jgi:hypothetical protein
MRRAALFAVTLSTLAAAAPAHAWMSAEGYRVEARGDGSFEVLASAGQSASESWCAAGAYVTRFLADGPTTRILRVSAPPRRAGEGVRFALAASAEGPGQPTGLLMPFGAPSDNTITAGFAESLCGGTGPIRPVAAD